VPLGPGDEIVVAPGNHEGSLVPKAVGSPEKPALIRFLPGTHEFTTAGIVSRPWHVSNSCDAPTEPKPIAILVEDARHLRVTGAGADGEGRTLLVMGGRMVLLANHRSSDIAFSGLAFDLKRPTVSEFRVEEAGPDHAVIRVAEGSTFEVKDGRFAWTGDLGRGGVMVQQAIPAEGKCWRQGMGWDPFGPARAEDLGGGRVRLTYAKGNPGLQAGRQFQFRHVFRDSAGGINDRCARITFRDCTFHALTNMGIVSQFTEDLVYERVRFVPPPGTLRTCPCWADALHFSGCRGTIVVESCEFSGLQDDPINVHGTHLRIMGRSGDRQLHLRFMHPQTYGFAAFAPGDEIAVIGHQSLRELPGNPRRKVVAVERRPDDPSGKDWLVTLDGPAPDFGPNDVVDNLTWYPDFTARNNRVTMASCRGFLVTTRGKAVVEGNTFHRCAMPGLLVENDASGWFESGPVQDLLVRGNRFIGCGLRIHPMTKSPEQPVHRNIRIEDNFFDGSGIEATAVQDLSITGNRFRGAVAVEHHHCPGIRIEGNRPDADP
jgi:hypothetical protein